MPTARAAIAISLALSFYLIAMNTQAGWLFVIASLIIGVIAVDALLARRLLSQMDVRVRRPGFVAAGGVIQEECVVSFPRGLLLGVSAVDEETNASGRLGAIESGTHEVIELRGDARRGVYENATIRIETGWMLGMFKKRRVVTKSAPMVVHPPIDDVAWQMFEGIGAGEREGKRRARTGDYLGVRPAPGPVGVGRIHWRKTAERGVLVEKEFGAVSQHIRGIVLSGGLAVDEETFELGLSVAASLGVLLLGRGTTFTLTLPVSLTPKRTHQKDIQTFLRLLAGLERAKWIEHLPEEVFYAKGDLHSAALVITTDAGGVVVRRVDRLDRCQAPIARVQLKEEHRCWRAC